MIADALTWPASQAEGALTALARAAGLPTERDASAAGGALERAARRVGLEAEPVDAAFADLEALVAGAGPALVTLGPDKRVLALVGVRRGTARLATPDGPRAVPAAKVLDAIGGGIDPAARDAVDALLDRTKIPEARRARARAGLLRERLGGRRVGGVWLLRLPPTAPFLAQLRASGATRWLATVLAAHAGQYAALMVAWWAIGSATLDGRLDRGWLFAWGLLLLTSIPLRWLELAAQGRASVEISGLLKRRTFEGTLRLEPEEMRGEGAGQLLGRTLEANSLEALATSRGIGAITATVDVVVACVVLALGAAPALQLVAFGAWLALIALAVRRYGRARETWTDERIGITHDLVERMVGHRTRVAQQARERWYDGDDRDLSRYLHGSRALDRAALVLTALLPAGWVIVGLAALVPGIVSTTSTPGAIALSVGGVLLAFRAVRQVAFGARDLVGVRIAWRRVRLLFESGGRAEAVAATAPMTSARPGAPRPAEHATLSAQNVVFRWRPGTEPVLRGCDLRVGAGDRLLLEGPSGGGKSTLALVLAGVRPPESGTMLVDGLDRHTTGDSEWRRRIVAVPQFHENHVISSTFAFNLLMGRRWPPLHADLALAERVCAELGLDALVARMPAGLLQVVGETGWQLSHGERSRLFIARAILQEPELMVLDESFAALDPETMQRALACVTARAKALVVVAHP